MLINFVAQKLFVQYQESLLLLSWFIQLTAFMVFPHYNKFKWVYLLRFSISGPNHVDAETSVNQHSDVVDQIQVEFPLKPIHKERVIFEIRFTEL